MNLGGDIVTQVVAIKLMKRISHYSSRQSDTVVQFFNLFDLH